MTNKPIEVLFVTHSNAAYGANRSMGSLIRAQARQRNIELIGPCGSSKLKEALNLQNVSVCEFELPWCVFPLGPRSFFDVYSHHRRVISCKRRLAGWLKDKQVKIVYSNSSTILWGAWLAKRLKARHIWHLREFGDLDYDLHFKMAKKRFKQLLVKADSIICVSHSVAQHFDVEHLPTTDIIYNGVLSLTEMCQCREKTRRLSPVFRFGMIGFMTPGKGFEVGIRALAILKERGIIAELRIYGSGSPELQGELKALTGQLAISDQVMFLGYRENPSGIFDEIDCLVVAAKAEAFGRTTAEAMCYGVPVIGRATAGTAELIDDRVTGLLFRNTPQDLAKKMAELCTSPQLSTKLVGCAKKFAKEAFSEESYASKFNAIIGRLLSK